MTKQEMINAIYEKIANKELSFGCLFINPNNWDYSDCQRKIFTREYDWHIYYKTSYGSTWEDVQDRNYFTSTGKIIWHLVMIWDVLEYWDWKYSYPQHPDVICPPHDTSYSSPEDIILELWKKKRLPIESQQEECIEYIYNLI